MSGCARPVAEESLLDWWTGELSPAERVRVEEHLLSCDACSLRAEAVSALADGTRGLARRGELPAVLLPPVVDLLRREGRRIREYRVAAGGGVRCTVGPEDDVVLARLRADLRGVQRLDLVLRLDETAEQRFADLPFDPSADEVLLAPSASDLRERPAHVERMRLLAVGPEGERLLGEYTFDHRPWPGW